MYDLVLPSVLFTRAGTPRETELEQKKREAREARTEVEVSQCLALCWSWYSFDCEVDSVKGPNSLLRFARHRFIIQTYH